MKCQLKEKMTRSYNNHVQRNTLQLTAITDDVGKKEKTSWGWAGPSSAQAGTWLYFCFFENLPSINPALEWKKIIQWSPLWIIFKGKIKISCRNNQCIETIIFCKLDHFWAALRTKKFFPPQNRDFENGVIFKISKS